MRDQYWGEDGGDDDAVFMYIHGVSSSNTRFQRVEIVLLNT